MRPIYCQCFSPPSLGVVCAGAVTLLTNEDTIYGRRQRFGPLTDPPSTLKTNT